LYRGQIKAKDLIGIWPQNAEKGIAKHWQKCVQRGQPLQAAGVIGAVPVISYVAAQKMPGDKDEFTVAGALQGKPIKLVKCETVDLEVPATAEIVMEGIIRTDYLEPEGPFGESNGYVDPRTISLIFEVKCITHRKNPIIVSLLSQVTPSESSQLRRHAWEVLLLDHLKNQCDISSVIRVVCHERLVNLRFHVVIQMKKRDEFEPWRAMYAVLAHRADLGKVIVCVDEDIDPSDLESVNAAICFRSQPHKDVRIVTGREIPECPIATMLAQKHAGTYDRVDSSLLIDATRKCDMPPLALPKKDIMENARQLWEELNLPKLAYNVSPWYGYSLGYWSEELEEEAELALQGKSHLTGEKLRNMRFKVTPGDTITTARERYCESTTT
jgi:4-hydroxy-3-polyprenylbenzoate decarboxylase